MHDPYDDEDDGYDDDHYDYDDVNEYEDPYKFYFKFDVSNLPLSEWIQKAINDLLGNSYDIQHVYGFPITNVPVNYWNPDTAKSNSLQYLGSNKYGEPIWKQVFFLHNKIQIAYKNHLMSNAKHFVEQPNYYRGMFDILN